MISNRV